MDSWLAKVNAFRTFGFELLVEDQDTVEPEPSIAFFAVLGPMDVHY